MSTKPAVSVLILTFNHEQYIAEAIESVLSQEYSDLEIVCGDDCSKDRTRSILIDYHDRYPDKIKLVLHQHNKGISLNFNSCLEHCTGDYVFLLGGDDVFLPGKINQQVDFMENDLSIAISYHDVEVFSSETGLTQYLYSSRHKIFNGGADELIANGTFCCGCSVAVRRLNLPKCDLRIKYSSDWLWYIDILKSDIGNTIKFFPGVFSRYRRHENNITSALARDAARGFAEVMLTLDIVEKKYPEHSNSVYRARCERKFVYAIKFILCGEYGSGLRLLVSVLRENIRSPWYFICRKLKLGI